MALAYAINGEMKKEQCVTCGMSFEGVTEVNGE